MAETPTSTAIDGSISTKMASSPMKPGELRSSAETDAVPVKPAITEITKAIEAPGEKTEVRMGSLCDGMREQNPCTLIVTTASAGDDDRNHRNGQEAAHGERRTETKRLETEHGENPWDECLC